MKLTKEKEEQLAKLMEDYNATDLGELVDILPDLDPELLEDDYEDEDELPQLPQQEEVDLDKVVLNLKESAVLGDVTYPFSPFPFN